ncbi:MAG: NAD(P)-dependent oxidoreductase [Bacteroidetes bacterium]|nr:NAD(P)-dependent oxidoreductase [Bacteroidota bacterium]
MKILVTGGSGSVGKYIVTELLDRHHAVGILDRVPPNEASARFHQVDVLNLPDVVEAACGYDAVIHCAGIPHPLNDPPEKVFTTNVNGTFNILEAAARNNIRKVVFTSSESTLGFAFMTNRMAPEYIPIDEKHPLRPQDPYGLSKIISERMCQSYSARYGIRTVCLRAPWIWVPEKNMIPFYQSLVAEYEQWWKNLWTYVHVFDAAQAHRLAVENDLERLHEQFFITAKENWTEKNSHELIEKFFPETKILSAENENKKIIISHAKAKALLGYEPHYSLHDLFSGA